jgi:hypothetical protein
MAKKNVTLPQERNYEAERAAEKRSNCLHCGVSDARCTRMVFKQGKACCSTCGYTDTHPKPKQKPDSAPCIRCHGSGIEPGEDDGC